MSRNPIQPVEEVQEIEDNLFQESGNFDPETPQRFFTNNIVVRALSHLVGRGKTKSIPVEATESGALKVAIVGGGTTVYDVRAKAAIADAFASKEFTEIVSRVDITTWTYPVIIELSADGVTYGADIYINKDTFYSVDQSVHTMKFKNGTPGSNASLQLVGWY